MLLAQRIVELFHPFFFFFYYLHSLTLTRASQKPSKKPDKGQPNGKNLHVGVRKFGMKYDIYNNLK